MKRMQMGEYENQENEFEYIDVYIILFLNLFLGRKYVKYLTNL